MSILQHQTKKSLLTSRSWKRAADTRRVQDSKSVRKIHAYQKLISYFSTVRRIGLIKLISRYKLAWRICFVFNIFLWNQLIGGKIIIVTLLMHRHCNVFFTLHIKFLTVNNSCKLFRQAFFRRWSSSSSFSIHNLISISRRCSHQCDFIISSF